MRLPPWHVRTVKMAHRSLDIYIYNFVKIASTNVLTITAVIINYHFRCVDESFLSIIQMVCSFIWPSPSCWHTITLSISWLLWLNSSHYFFLLLLLFNYIINILYYNDMIKRKPTTIPCFERNLSAGRLFPRYYFLYYYYLFIIFLIAVCKPEYIYKII